MRKITLTKIFKAESLIDRSLGLMGRRSFGHYNGFLIKNTNAVHTFFVLFPIDILFLDKDLKVLALKENVKPFSISPFVLRSNHVLELPKGEVNSLSIKIGDQIDLV